MSVNPERSPLAQLARQVHALLRQAGMAESRGRLPEAITHLQEVVRLDPRDRRPLQKLGELHARLGQSRRAAAWYARAARGQEADGFAQRAISLWRLAARCDPSSFEAQERVGVLYLELGRTTDARQHYERAARELEAAGQAADAAILRAQLAAAPEVAPDRSSTAAPAPVPTHAVTRPPPASGPDADALDLAADRLQNGRLFLHYGLVAQAREQLERLVADIPDHVEGRRLLVEACRALGDEAAAAHHFDRLTAGLRRAGQAEGPEAEPPAADEVAVLPPIEEWAFDDPAPDLATQLMDEIRADVERVVDRLGHPALKWGGK
jgi:tetratricopeptide (TPR) repeat protein